MQLRHPAVAAVCAAAAAAAAVAAAAVAAAGAAAAGYCKGSRTNETQMQQSSCSIPLL